jgi:hypothetical protein
MGLSLTLTKNSFIAAIRNVEFIWGKYSGIAE